MMNLENNSESVAQDTNYRELSLNLPILRSDYAYPKNFENHSTHRLDVTEDLHPEVKKFFELINLKVKGLIFNTPPYGKCSIHVDGYTMHQQWGINWVWGSNNHKMSWWMPKEKKIDFSRAQETNSKTPYMFWSKEETNFLQSVKIVRPTLIKTGIPHMIENFSNTERWSVSIRPINPSTWPHALKIFKDYLL